MKLNHFCKQCSKEFICPVEAEACTVPYETPCGDHMFNYDIDV